MMVGDEGPQRCLEAGNPNGSECCGGVSVILFGSNAVLPLWDGYALRLSLMSLSGSVGEGGEAGIYSDATTDTERKGRRLRGG